MTLKLYDKKLLNFMYELTKLKRFTSSANALSKIITLENSKKVTPKTIQKWFAFLDKPWYFKNYYLPSKFSYFPRFYSEKLGLMKIYVISEKPKTKLRTLFPFQAYIAWLYDSTYRKKLLITYYLIPSSYLEKFKFQWEKAKNLGIVKNYKFYILNKNFIIYSPWYKVINEYGIFNPNKNVEEEINEKMQLFNSYFNSTLNVELVSEIKKNPLLIPAIFEYNKECWTSVKVWKAIKDKLDDKTWKYIRKQRSQTNYVGIKKIQQTIRDLHRYNLFHYIRLTYLPLELNHNFFVYIPLEFRTKKEAIKNIRRLAMNSIFINIYTLDKNKAFLIALINNEALQNFFDILENVKVERIMFLRHEKSLPLLLRYYKFNYHELFDPEKLKWVWK